MKKRNASFSRNETLRWLTVCMERVMRIELTTSAWKAEVLPLNYTRMNKIHNLSNLRLNFLAPF
jgi:hypothetical protein